MAFIEVKRYHVQCDKPTCGNLYTVFDLTDNDDDDGIIVEVEYPQYSGFLCAALNEAGWQFIGDKVYCAECQPNSYEDSLFEFLKADMTI